MSHHAALRSLGRVMSIALLSVGASPGAHAGAAANDGAIVGPASIPRVGMASIASRLVQDSPGPAAFGRVCAACHGADAKGKSGPALLPFEREYLEVQGIVRDGRGEMPAISPADVSDEELLQIVAYLTKLSAEGAASQTAADSPSSRRREDL